ncbi:MAG: EF-hand domain-containing protein [Armatimonadia bacterium]
MTHATLAWPGVLLLVCVLACLPACGQINSQMSRPEIAARVRQFDANKDGQVTREEFRGPENVFRFIDRNGDGVITAEELTAFVNAAPQQGAAGAQTAGAPVGSIPVDVKPLSAMSATDRYKGEDGGLYGQGQNTPPPAHLQAALDQARQIQPLDGDGNPSPQGKIGFISFGMSNTTQEFQVFLHDVAPLKLSPNLVIVDGAQGGMEATAWAKETKSQQGRGPTAWEELANRLHARDLSARQVQVVWMKLAVAGPARDGAYPAHVQRFRELVTTCLQKLKSRYPSVRLVYLSNRIYAGYATTELNPEPYAYEYAFGLRQLILDQIAGKPELNYDPAKGEAKSALLMWGPDLWANGATPRADGLAWQKEDLGPDGTHPSLSGREKVAQLLLRFLRTEPTARLWFVEQP